MGSALPPPVGETGFEPATPASRTQCSTGLSYSPISENPTYSTDGVGFEPTRRKPPTRSPGVRLKPLGHPSLRQLPAGRVAAARRAVVPPTPSERRGWDSNPRGPFGPNALAGRRLKPLGHLSESTNPPSCPSWVRTRTLLIQSQACCQLHQGAIHLSARLTAADHRRRNLDRLHRSRHQSGRRDSNPRPSAWEADALPTELLPRLSSPYPRNGSGFPRTRATGRT